MCNPRSHHVDGIFIEGVLVCAFGVVHQNLWLERASDGALLKALAWKTNSGTEKKEFKDYHIITEGCLLSPLLRQTSLHDAKDRTEHITKRPQLWFMKNVGQCDLVWSWKMKFIFCWQQGPFCSKKGKSFQVLCNSTHNRDTLEMRYNTPHPWISAEGNSLCLSREQRIKYAGFNTPNALRLRTKNYRFL